MPDKYLHIVSFDIPFPADYGGVIDVFYKIKALHKEGIKIHLHCFEYGRKHSDELNKYCVDVNYYPRKSGLKYWLNPLPYIVSTRVSEELIHNLSRDTYPILFEGLHSCYYLEDERLKNKTKIVRTHNIEHNYYAHLAEIEKSLFKKYYLSSEAKKLRKFERVLNQANYITAISTADAKELDKRYKNVVSIPAFHSDEKVQVSEGKGEFALYHGNLKVGENNQAALFLVNEVFSNISVPLIIAGNNPSPELVNAAKKFKNIQIKSNISTEEIYSLIRSAQINILPTFQSTGIKLKLLAALFNGRHCIVNSPMVENTGLESLCCVKNTAEEMKNEVLRLFTIPFEAAELKKREEILLKDFSNKLNAEKLIALL